MENGTVINQYKIISPIGKGGMGEVFLAQDTRLDRKVAIKFLNEEFSRDADKLKRFVREAKAVSALNHPNILTVYEIGEKDEANFIVTEFIEGETLREQLSPKETNSLNQILKIGVQVAEALSAAHQAGIVHRDIKPENIMIRADGYAKVLDFGLAKLVEKAKPDEISPEGETKALVNTNPGVVMGTVSYMSPEQARGKDIDARTDIWSLGVVLYEMLSGKVPFTGETINHTIVSILEKEPLLLENAPDELQRIVRKTLTKEVEMRYQTARDLLIDLKNLRRNLDIQGELERSIVPNREITANQVRENETQIYTEKSIEETKAEDARKTQNVTTSSSLEYAVIQAKSHKFATAIVGIILLGVISAVAYFGFFARSNANQIESIAVMPFVNVGDDRDSEYLADGLSENLINTLSRLPQLKVIARTSSFKFRGENIDIQDAARKLGVGAILTGRVVRRGDDLQISVELINTADNTRIWGDIYNRKVSAALSMPEEIAQAVSEKLQLKLSGAQERQMAKQITDNPQAYQSYMNGVFFRRKNGAENIRKAIEYQKQAIALDPSFVRAYTELAINFTILVEIAALNPKEGMPPARAAAEKALSLDETLAEAHYALARVRDFEFDWAGAEQGFKRAIELNPNLAGAHTLYAEYLSRSGRFDEALREVKRAQELDPLRTGLVGNEGLIFYHARRYDEAIAKKQIHAQLAAENPFAYLELANAYVQKGQYAEAILSYQTSIKLEETTSALIYLGRFYALTGKRNEAMAILDKLKTTEKYVSPTELAILYAALGDKEKAFASLEKAYTERDFQLTSLKVEPGYDSLRYDPRFKDLLKRMNLPQ